MKFAIIGHAISPYGAAILRHMLEAGLTPTACLLQDPEPQHQALTRAIYFGGAQGYDADGHTRFCKHPENPDDLYRLVESAAVPCYGVADYADPVVTDFLARYQVDVIVNLDAPPLKGGLLYHAPFGVLSIHAADLPHFRGNDATVMNIYNNTPLRTSAFIMTPWMDEGGIVEQRSIPVHEGDTLAQINARALEIGAALYCDVLKALDAGKISFKRQNEWEGVTYRRSGSAGHAEHAIGGQFVDAVTERLKKKYSYAYATHSED